MARDEKYNHQDSYRTGEQIDEEHLLCFTQTVQYAAEHSAYVHQWAQKTQSSKEYPQSFDEKRKSPIKFDSR